MTSRVFLPHLHLACPLALSLTPPSLSPSLSLAHSRSLHAFPVLLALLTFAGGLARASLREETHASIRERRLHPAAPMALLPLYFYIFHCLHGARISRMTRITDFTACVWVSSCAGGCWKVPFPLVDASPEIRCCQLTPHDEFLIIGCDGVWDVMSSQDAVDLARAHIPLQPPAEPEGVGAGGIGHLAGAKVIGHAAATAAAKVIADTALERGSLDNITVLVMIFLRSTSQNH